jgi:hypothetical protein
METEPSRREQLLAEEQQLTEMLWDGQYWKDGETVLSRLGQVSMELTRTKEKSE